MSSQPDLRAVTGGRAPKTSNSERGVRIEPAGIAQNPTRTATDEPYPIQHSSIAEQSVAEEDKPVLAHRFTLIKPPTRSLFSKRTTRSDGELTIDIVPLRWRLWKPLTRYLLLVDDLESPIP